MIYILFVCLLLGANAETVNPSEVRSEIFPDENYFTDFVSIDESHSLFFWLFKSRDKNEKAPLLLFLQGGPGTSGVEAALYENGPYRISRDLQAKRVADSLNNKTDVIYIDQPIGTGFSKCPDITRLPISEKNVADDLYTFLLGFMKKYPAYKGRPLYLMTQSFGGHFVPGAIPIIHKKNNKDINIKGIAIGNGHIDPVNQFPQYAEYAYKKKLISLATYEVAKGMLVWCKFYLKLGTLYITFIETYCTGAYNTILGIMPFMKFNPYDVREPCHIQPACYDFSKLQAFMDRPEVLNELNVGGQTWLMTNLLIIASLRFDYWMTYSDGLTYLLEQKIPVILYYGKEDFVCNYLGGIETIRNLKWHGARELLNKNYKSWTVDGKHMGDYKHYDSLTYLEVFNAGHMALMDNPRIGVDILDRLINNGPY